VPLNLTAKKSDVVEYFVTGTWSNKAAKEAEKYATVHYVLPKTESYTNIPPSSEWTLSPDATYVYYCDNETVHGRYSVSPPLLPQCMTFDVLSHAGVEFPSVPEINSPTLVCDMSSNFLTRTVDFTKFGLVYAGVQKNAGCAGLSVVIGKAVHVGCQC
jgi:phosphoserine aminotransferase